MKKPVCTVQGCQDRIKKGKLMCPAHWGQLPPEIRKSITKHHKPGQNIYNASPAYLGALKDAKRFFRQEAN